MAKQVYEQVTAALIEQLEQGVATWVKPWHGDDYYATAFHELAHWTGAKSRLDRDLSGRFGNPDYALEELVAELGSAFLCARHGVTGHLQHAEYLGNWLAVLKADSGAIFKAASLAQKAANFVAPPVAVETLAEAA